MLKQKQQIEKRYSLQELHLHIDIPPTINIYKLSNGTVFWDLLLKYVMCLMSYLFWTIGIMSCWLNFSQIYGFVVALDIKSSKHDNEEINQFYQQSTILKSTFFRKSVYIIIQRIYTSFNEKRDITTFVGPEFKVLFYFSITPLSKA